MASPMTVERRWPTCISLGEVDAAEIDDDGLAVGAGGVDAERRRVERGEQVREAHPRRRRMLMKPGPAMLASVTGSAISARSSLATMALAMSRGGLPSVLARGIAALDWKSPN